MEKMRKKPSIFKTWTKIRFSILSDGNSNQSSFSGTVPAGKTKTRAPPAAPSSEEDRTGNNGDGQDSVYQIIRKKKEKSTKTGCFTVYVGPKKHRFWVKTELVNHPLFKNLLEDAEKEFGYTADGPIVLPCEVHLFYRVLAEIDSLDGDDDEWSADLVRSPVCWLCIPYRYDKPNFLVKDRFGSYKRLKMSPMIRMNMF